MSTIEERSSPLKDFVLTALVKDILPAIEKAKEAAWNVKAIITRHYAWMQQTSNHSLQEQSSIIQIQEKKTSYSARESRHLLSYYGITCRALLNTGAGSSYTSSMLARELKEPSIRTDYK